MATPGQNVAVVVHRAGELRLYFRLILPLWLLALPGY